MSILYACILEKVLPNVYGSPFSVLDIHGTPVTMTAILENEPTMCVRTLVNPDPNKDRRAIKDAARRATRDNKAFVSVIEEDFWSLDPSNEMHANYDLAIAHSIFFDNSIGHSRQEILDKLISLNMKNILIIYPSSAECEFDFDKCNKGREYPAYTVYSIGESGEEGEQWEAIRDFLSDRELSCKYITKDQYCYEQEAARI